MSRLVWDNAGDQTGGTCYKLSSDSESMRIAGSALLEYALRYPDLKNQNYLERPLHHFQYDIQSILMDIGLQLLGRKECDQLNDIRIEDCKLQKQMLNDDTWYDVATFGPKLPVGMIFASVTDTTPDGCLWCNGEYYSKLVYPDLYALLPSVLKDSDGFYAPDLRARVLVGDNPSSYSPGGIDEVDPDAPNFDVGSWSGAWKHALSSSENGPHTHQQQRWGGAGTSSVNRIPSLATSEGISQVGMPETAPSGTGAKHNNAQPYFSIRWFIVASPDCTASAEASMSLFQLRQNEDDNCILEQTQDGLTWSPAFDYSLCQPATNVYQDSQIINNYFQENNELNIYIDNNTIENIYPDAATETIDNQDFWQPALCFSFELFVRSIIEMINELNERDANEIPISKKTAAYVSAGLAVTAAIAGLLAAIPTGGLSLSVTGLAWTGFGTSLSSVALGLYASSGNPVPDPLDFTQSEINEVVCCVTSYWLTEGEMTFTAFQEAIANCTGLSINAGLLALRVFGFMQDKRMYMQFYGMFADAYRAAEDGFNLPDCPCDDDCVVYDYVWTSEATTPAGWSGSLYTQPGGVFVSDVSRASNANWTYLNDVSTWHFLRVTFDNISCIPTLVSGNFSRGTNNQAIYQIYARIGVTWTKVSEVYIAVGGSIVTTTLSWLNPDALQVDEIEFRCWTREPIISRSRIE